MTTAPDPREPLGKVVRDVWVAAVRELIPDPKPSWIEPWETLTDQFQREVDMRIGEAVAAVERNRLANRAAMLDEVKAELGDAFQFSHRHGYVSREWVEALLATHAASAAAAELEGIRQLAIEHGAHIDCDDSWGSTPFAGLIE